MARITQNNSGNGAKTNSVPSSTKVHRAARGHLSEGGNARSFQDQGLGGRGDMTNKEQGLGKNSRAKRFGKGRAKASVLSKDLKRIERNLGARH